jgi:hypothetical protein
VVVVALLAVLAARGALGAQEPSAPLRMSGYRVSLPAGWQRAAGAAEARLERHASDGGTVTVQLRPKVAAVFTVEQVVGRVLDAIAASNGIHDPMGSPLTSQRIGRRSLACIGRSYVDRTGAPVFLIVMAFREGLTIGVLQAESRRASAIEELRDEVSALAVGVQFEGSTSNTRITAELITMPDPMPPSRPAVASASGDTARPAESGAGQATLPAEVSKWPPMSDGPRLSGVWTMFETGRLRSGIGLVERIYVYWPDGRVLMTFPSGGVVHPGETRFAGIDDGYWGRYTVRGDSLEMTWNEGRGRAMYPLARVATDRLDRGTIRPAAPPVRNLRLRGTWEAPEYEGRRFITFDESGAFATGDVGLPNTAGRGTYVIDGYAMLLQFDNGTRERISFVALDPGQTPRTITLERMPLALRK